MNHILREHTFSGSQQKVFQGLSDYFAYPRHINGVTHTYEAEKQDAEASCAVGYELVVIKSFHYVLDMYHREYENIAWNLTQSNFLTHNSGSWSLSEHGPYYTKVQYELKIDFKTMIPSMIVKQLTTRSLPLMFRGFQKLIDAQEEPS